MLFIKFIILFDENFSNHYLFYIGGAFKGIYGRNKKT